jgi:transposase InsO family protein
VDHFSKWAESIPVQNHTASTVARALMSHFFTYYGAPKQLLSDRGPEFESELFKELMHWMEIKKFRTSPYKASTNAACEVFHCTLNSMLGKVVKECQRYWDKRLPQVMAAYRTSPHSSTGFSPNGLFLGRGTRMPLDLIMGIPTEKQGRQPMSADTYVQKIEMRLKPVMN